MNAGNCETHDVPINEKQHYNDEQILNSETAALTAFEIFGIRNIAVINQFMNM